MARGLPFRVTRRTSPPLAFTHHTLEDPMKTAKKMLTSALLGLGLLTGAAQQAAAQDSIDCEYIGTTIEIYRDAIVITDWYWC
jgi:hypothetical protein